MTEACLPVHRVQMNLNGEIQEVGFLLRENDTDYPEFIATDLQTLPLEMLVGIFEFPLVKQTEDQNEPHDFDGDFFELSDGAIVDLVSERYGIEPMYIHVFHVDVPTSGLREWLRYGKRKEEIHVYKSDTILNTEVG